MTNRNKQPGSLRRIGTFRKVSLVAAFGVLSLRPAFSAQVEHVVLEVEDSIGLPAVQALIVACVGEPVFLTGTVRITLVDGVATHFNWGGMVGETADGDRFVGGSGVTIGTQSNLTLVEVNAGSDARQFHLQIVGGELSVVCHN